MTGLESELKQRREELVAELTRLTEPPEAGSSIGFGKRVGDGTSEAVERLATTAVARSLAQSIEDIDAALLRLAAGSYGYCEVCGELIPPERLLARPATARCVRCAD